MLEGRILGCVSDRWGKFVYRLPVMLLAPVMEPAPPSLACRHLALWFVLPTWHLHATWHLLTPTATERVSLLLTSTPYAADQSASLFLVRPKK